MISMNYFSCNHIDTFDVVVELYVIEMEGWSLVKLVSLIPHFLMNITETHYTLENQAENTTLLYVCGLYVIDFVWRNNVTIRRNFDTKTKVDVWSLLNLNTVPVKGIMDLQRINREIGIMIMNIHDHQNHDHVCSSS